ncbi:MAG: AarF/ABC1/UbiB kinase family protein, partial [bacterium]
RAQLKTGELVAVKVQRPDLRRQIELDTAVLIVLAGLADRYLTAWRDYNLKSIIEEFRRWTLNEIDYRKEASNCEVFYNLFAKDKFIFSPKVYWDYTTTEILTLEYVDGYCLRDIIDDNLEPEILKHIDKKKLAHHFGDAFIKQYFEFGFFHADPHPGNIYVVGNNKLKFLDFGMVGVLDSRLTSIAAGIFLSLLQKNSENIVHYMMELENDYNDGNDWEGKVKTGNLRREINSLVLQWSNSGRAGQFTKLYYNLVNTAVKNGVSVPVDLIMLTKSILTIDVIVEKLDNKFRLEDWEGQMVKQILDNKIKSWDRSRLQNLLVFADNFIKDMPEAIPKIVKQLEGLGKKNDDSGITKYAEALYWHARINSYGLVVLAGVIIYLLFIK